MSRNGSVARQNEVEMWLHVASEADGGYVQ